jgi:hypothetical protein
LCWASSRPSRGDIQQLLLMAIAPYSFGEKQGQSLQPHFGPGTCHGRSSSILTRARRIYRAEALAGDQSRRASTVLGSSTSSAHLETARGAMPYCFFRLSFPLPYPTETLAASTDDDTTFSFISAPEARSIGARIMRRTLPVLAHCTFNFSVQEWVHWPCLSFPHGRNRSSVTWPGRPMSGLSGSLGVEGSRGSDAPPCTGCGAGRDGGVPQWRRRAGPRPRPAHR